mmetsp:Transcript_22056/g.54142  ORF Transcript_22056/g.54142 Transcript_22056/m.54142 type:complete len:134 (+) Transcript_22056:317-718(+)
MKHLGKLSFTEDEIRHAVRALVRSMTFMHAKRIVHRDVKANNLLLTRKGRVKLCDFGACVQLGGDTSACRTPVGTLTHIAPEAVYSPPSNLERHYGSPADIWGLGVTCIELAERDLPVDRKYIENKGLDEGQA